MMSTNDEDLELFLGELLPLLRKYNYIMSPFQLIKLSPDFTYVSWFNAVDNVFHHTIQEETNELG